MVLSQSPFQPFAAWYALVCSISVLLMQGYWVFLKGESSQPRKPNEISLTPLLSSDNWDTPSFIFAYAMPIVRHLAGFSRATKR